MDRARATPPGDRSRLAAVGARVVLVDHATGAVTFVAANSRAQAELASALTAQARAMRTAAVGAPPPRHVAAE